MSPPVLYAPVCAYPLPALSPLPRVAGTLPFPRFIVCAHSSACSWLQWLTGRARARCGTYPLPALTHAGAFSLPAPVARVPPRRVLWLPSPALPFTHARGTARVATVPGALFRLPVAGAPLPACVAGVWRSLLPALTLPGVLTYARGVWHSPGACAHSCAVACDRRKVCLILSRCGAVCNGSRLTRVVWNVPPRCSPGVLQWLPRARLQRAGACAVPGVQGVALFRLTVHPWRGVLSPVWRVFRLIVSRYSPQHSRRALAPRGLSHFDGSRV